MHVDRLVPSRCELVHCSRRRSSHISTALAHHRRLQRRSERVTWGCFFLLGAGLLAPWNAVLTATDYMQAVFPDHHVDRLFTIAYLPTCLFMLGAMIRARNLFTSRMRILTGYTGFAVLMAAIPLVRWPFRWARQPPSRWPSCRRGKHADCTCRGSPQASACLQP